MKGRKRIACTARDVLSSMIEHAEGCISCLLAGKGVPHSPDQLRAELCKLSKAVYDRRKKMLCISDAGFAMVDTGRGLENLVLLLYELEGPVTPQRAEMLRYISGCLSSFQAFVKGEAAGIPPLCREAFEAEDSARAGQFYQCLLYIQTHILQMAQPENKRRYRKTLLSLSVRLKAAFRVSPVRAVYALRVSCLLAACTLLVQMLGLPHGKWLLFTVASVSLPYADDVGAKAKKRMLATFIGGLCSILIFSLIPSSTGRTVVMMLSGYLSFYFTNYSATFACSTVGALGGAVFMGAFGWGAVGAMTAIRFGYVIAGVLIALFFNLVCFPFKREKATRQLFQKYLSTVKLLTRVCQKKCDDSQLYYGLVIQAHLLEDKLGQNIQDLNWEGAKDLLKKCREAIRAAHRQPYLNSAQALF
ncbi:MAG: FUSC family protein [Oscillospiraceae bacterium]|nr:FUSC family protein [Oscillospiraceae bacterium]